ncbi:MAG: hypothetical protein ACRCU5_09795 [Rhizobiaceae bacterium]
MAGIFFVTALMCGCASNTIDEAVPVATAGPTASAPRNTGQYPNINIVPVGETAQLSDAETAATRAELEGEAQVQQQRGESAEAYVERLRRLQRLGSTHAAATLKQIEDSQ